MKYGLRVAVIISVLSFGSKCFAGYDLAIGQTPPLDKKQTAKLVVANDPPVPTASGNSKNPKEDPPLTDRERALLDLIRDLQERVTRLESQRSEPSQAAVIESRPPDALASAGKVSAIPIAKDTSTDASVKAPVSPADEAHGQADDKKWGTYTPNLGFKVADTPYGDMNISIYSYVRYLNQLGLDGSYTDAFGNIKSVQRRQDFQITKVQMKFLGWVLSPKLRYFLYAWSSNANQGKGAQVVLAGNLNYTFNKHITLSGGIRSLPGTRSVEGNFPFWFSVDSRLITDEFMRPSYTSGIWATGDITDRLSYQVMIGNNMSTLGVSAAQLDNGLNTFSSAIIWHPTTGEYGPGFSDQGWGDFENHDKFATRLAAHFNRSNENKESQSGEDTFENTQLRLSDGSVIFTPNLFGQGVTISDARWRMSSVDGGFKYRGFSLEGEYYWRWLDDFKFSERPSPLPAPGPPTSLFDHGFQLQGSAMVVQKTLQAYAGYSKIFGQYGQPWDFRFGMNWFPFKNHVVRWNTEALYLYKSPVGYTSVPFAVGGKGWVFHSTFEVAF